LLEASESESNVDQDRISLIAVVRGLEAVPDPGHVTLVTNSRYVARGLQYGLSEWREHDYCWEHFGSIQPVRNADLWRRIDRTMQFHSMRCRLVETGNAAAGSRENAPDLSGTQAAIDSQGQNDWKSGSVSNVGQTFGETLLNASGALLGRFSARRSNQSTRQRNRWGKSAVGIRQAAAFCGQLMLRGLLQIASNFAASLHFLFAELLQRSANNQSAAT
jgi:hypothetical protein